MTCMIMMHRYRLADIEIYIITDNRSDSIFTEISYNYIWQNCYSKTLFQPYFTKNNVIRVCKINWPINQLIITNTDTANMWSIKPITDY